MIITEEEKKEYRAQFERKSEIAQDIIEAYNDGEISKEQFDKDMDKALEVYIQDVRWMQKGKQNTPEDRILGKRFER